MASTGVLATFLLTEARTPDKSNLREKALDLAYSLKGYSLSWYRESVDWSQCIQSKKAGSEQEVGWGSKPQGPPTASDALPPARLHLVKVSQFPHIVPPFGGTIIQTHKPMGAHATFKPQ